MSSFPRFAALVLGLTCGLGLVSAQFPIAAQQNQQRPRRVNPQAAPQATPPPAVAARPTGDEVDEGDVVRVETQLVSVPAVVTNKSGRPLTGLRAENFLLFENGQQQKITNFATTEAPFEIALLLDTSGSTRVDVGLIRDAANAFIDALRPGARLEGAAAQDAGPHPPRRLRDAVEVLLIVDGAGAERQGQSVAAKVEVLSQLTGDRKQLRAAIENLGSSNGTPFYDGLVRIADEVFNEPPREEMSGRRAIVALTDGVDSTSETDFQTARSKLSRAGVASYFIQVNTEDFVEDRLLKDCQDDGRLTLSAKQLERYRKAYFPRARPDDFTDFCQMGPFEKMQISRDIYNLARREMNEIAKASG